MSLALSDIPRSTGATSLSNPGFDIILAVSSARQAALPTVRLLGAWAERASYAAKLNARCEMFGGTAGGARSVDVGPARFFELSDRANGPSETVNGPFTRAFQPMLNPWRLDLRPSVEPMPPIEDFME